MIKICYVVPNMFNFDPVISPPSNLPPDIIPIYITDSYENVTAAQKLGWTAYNIDKYRDISCPSLYIHSLITTAD